jgi:hypothetical protein
MLLVGEKLGSARSALRVLLPVRDSVSLAALRPPIADYELPVLPDIHDATPIRTFGASD